MVVIIPPCVVDCIFGTLVPRFALSPLVSASPRISSLLTRIIVSYLSTTHTTNQPRHPRSFYVDHIQKLCSVPTWYYILEPINYYLVHKMGVRCIDNHLYEKKDVLGTIATRKRKDVYMRI